MIRARFAFYAWIALLLLLGMSSSHAVTFTQLTTNSAVDMQADWSPLGDKIVFCSNRSGNYGIWVIPITGEPATKLTESYDSEPKWSPDGTKIVFQSTRLSYWDVYTMTSTGGSITRITTFTDCVNSDWSPGGSKIVYRHYSAGNYDLYTIPATGGTPTRLTTNPSEESFPEYSPDGNKIVFQYLPGVAGSRDVYTMPASGGAYTPLATDPTDDGVSPSWSPDGNWIAFSSDRSGNRDIWVMDSRGESYGLWQITTDPAIDEWPSWSPGGDKIVFHSERSGNRELWIATDLPMYEPEYPDPHDYLATLRFDGQDLALPEPFRESETNFPMSFRFNATQDGNGDGVNSVEDNLENLILYSIGDELLGNGRTGLLNRGPNDQRPAVYFHKASVGEYEVWEYWLYYGDNDYWLHILFDHEHDWEHYLLFDHEHDWEHYFIYLRDGIPEYVSLSYHFLPPLVFKFQDGFTKDEFDKIKIFVDRGSHAMLPDGWLGFHQDGVEIRSDGRITKHEGILSYGEDETYPWIIYSNDAGFTGITPYNNALPSEFYYGDPYYLPWVPWIIAEFWFWSDKDAPWERPEWTNPPYPIIDILLAIKANSPIDLELLDPTGVTVSKENPASLSGSYLEDDLDGDGQTEDCIIAYNPLPGRYGIRVIPEPGALPNDTYTLEAYLDTVKYVLAKDVRIENIPDKPYSFWTIPVGSISGTVSDSLGGLFGVVVDLFDNTGVLAQFTCSDTSGFFEFDSVDADDYTISIVTPLGYVADFESRPITVTWNADSTVDFTLHRLDIVPSQRSMGYWKHQVNVYLSGKGNAQESLADMSNYMSLVGEHFNNNLANPITIFEVPQPADQTDSLEALKDLLTVKGNSPMSDRAKQQLIALMLNVVSLKLDQATPISEDSTTVSQAITYCNQLIADSEPGNDEIAKDIADQINNGILVASEIIPLTTPNIVYKGTEGQVVQTPNLPKEFSLSQNYPNPFNPASEIEYTLPVDCKVTLSIYNILGQKVKVLVDEYQGAGQGSVRWDGKDEQGHEVTSGIYFYRIQAGDFVQSKKMVLMK